MSDRMSPRRGPDAEQVRHLLRREAASHEPDADGILHRVEEARRHRPDPDAGRYPSRTRLGWELPLAWATAAALLVIGVAAVQRLPGEDAVSSPSTVPSSSTLGSASTGAFVAASGSTSATPSGGWRSQGAPSSAATATRTAVTPPAATPPAVTSPVATSSVATVPTGMAGTPVVRLSPASDGTEVRLPRAGDRDWVLVGSRRDGKVVRAKDGSEEIVDVSAHGALASVVPGSWRLSWTGGSPEQDRSGASTWSSVPSGSGHQQVVVRLRSPGTIDVYLGARTPSGTASVTLMAVVTPPAGSASRERSVRTAMPSGGAVASVRVGDAAPGSTVTITLSGGNGGNGGELALSAVVVR
ncbi:MAG: hypothetical protein QG622_1343 [Actinomycetota bacterium]|nr:hypothetical protein [Actinomycetota bacterium]